MSYMSELEIVYTDIAWLDAPVRAEADKGGERDDDAYRELFCSIIREKFEDYFALSDAEREYIVTELRRNRHDRAADALDSLG